ncbi:phage head closure protein [Fructilactobacillus myrtifloralis]|uniref:Phage head closure protein n=1 Tax=Fructilactobacillus myrtifloralis TaxID=2940301 RepID=A0ABY5BN39_9LACO|nr:phage head closure protein [Fructilactobacillus myrtifloralis]USS85079.1 phage head closure protein [Fructilactobacillus myrtifloralis]
MKIPKLSAFCYTVQFYELVDDCIDENTGQSKPISMPTFKAKAAPLKRSRGMQWRANDLKLGDTVDIMVRHDDRISEQLQVRYDGELCNIISYQPDDSFSFGGYDILTIRQVSERN